MKNTETITGDLIINTGFKEHDRIAKIISDHNIKNGLKTIMGGAWTYEKLANNAAQKLQISYQEAYKLEINELLSLT